MQSGSAASGPRSWSRFMKIIKKLVIAIISAAFMLSSAATVLADETTTPSVPAAGTQASSNLSKMTFDTMYGSELPKYLNKQYYFNGEKIPVAESNYYYLLTFMQLSQYAAYGYLPATSDRRIDLTAQYPNGNQTVGQYLTEQAEKYLHSTYILMQRAKDAGLTLDDKDKQEIEMSIYDMKDKQAKPAGLTLDQAIKIYFGPHCDEAAYRAILENSQLAGKFQKKYVAEFNVPEEQKMIPSITYALHYAPEASASADEKKKANDAAQAMLKECKNIEDLKNIGMKAKSAGTVRDAGTVPVQKGKMVPAFEAWAWDAARKEGEMAVIYSQEYGYFCVGYNGKVEIDASEKADMANKALSTDIEAEMSSNKYGFKAEGKAILPGTVSSRTLVTVFGSIAATAVILLIVVIIMTKVKPKGGKNGKKSASGKKSSGKKSKKD